MAILAFQKPDKVVMLEANDKFGKFEFRPLEPGFGVTVGNALRRILLSSLEGYAINTIKIAGVEHEFSSVRLAENKGLTKIGIEELKAAGLTNGKELVKILGNGELKAKIDVEAHAFSKTAEEAIKAVGGNTTII